jgi:glycerol kinase
VIWNLTGGWQQGLGPSGGGVHVTDVSNASRTMLMDLRTRSTGTEMLAVMGVPRSMLPAIRSSSEVYGEAVGDLAGVPIAGDLGDQQAALFGQTCFAPGEAKNTYGTGCFMLLNTGDGARRQQGGLLTTVGYRIGTEPAVYALEGSIAITGALVQWLRDNLGLIRDIGRGGDARRNRRRQRRRLLRARLLRPVRAVLAQRRARRHRRPDALRQPRPHRPGRTGGDGLADARSARRHERRLGRGP